MGAHSVESDFETPCSVAQAPLSMGFSRQEHWSGLPWPPSGDLPNPGMEPSSLISSAQANRFFTTRATWEAHQSHCHGVYSDIESAKETYYANDGYLRNNSLQMKIWIYNLYICIHIYVFMCIHVSVIKMNTYLLFIMYEVLF